MPVTGATIAISIFIASRITSRLALDDFLAGISENLPNIRSDMRIHRVATFGHIQLGLRGILLGRIRGFAVGRSRQRPAFAFLVEGFLLSDLEGGCLVGDVS